MEYLIWPLLEGLAHLIWPLLEGLAQVVFEVLGEMLFEGLIHGVIECCSLPFQKRHERRAATTLVLTRSRNGKKPEL